MKINLGNGEDRISCLIKQAEMLFARKFITETRCYQRMPQLEVICMYKADAAYGYACSTKSLFPDGQKIIFSAEDYKKYYLEYMKLIGLM